RFGMVGNRGDEGLRAGEFSSVHASTILGGPAQPLSGSGWVLKSSAPDRTLPQSHLRWQEGPMASDRNRVSVAEAFAAVPRAPFLPATERTLTECNVPVAIGHGQTNSQPSTVADMLELLDVRLGDRVLDLGAGSGWTTALLSVL